MPELLCTLKTIISDDSSLPPVPHLPHCGVWDNTCSNEVVPVFVFNAFLVVVVVVIDVVLVVVAAEKIKCFHHYCVILLMFHQYGELQAGANQVPTGNYEPLVNLHSLHFSNCCCGGVS